MATLSPEPLPPGTPRKFHALDTTWSFGSSASKYHESGNKLLMCTELTGAEVRYHDRVWKAHKVILCTRSEWVFKAFTGPFEEGRTGIVQIGDFSEEEVDCLITFLYTGRK